MTSMIDVNYDENQVVVKFPKDLLTVETLQKMLDRLEVEVISQKSEMTEEQVWNLSEELKQNWWDKNKDRYLKGIK